MKAIDAVTDKATGKIYKPLNKRIKRVVVSSEIHEVCQIIFEDNSGTTTAFNSELELED